MRICVEDGVLYAKIPGYITAGCVYGTRDSVRFAKGELRKRQNHAMSAVELKHDLSSDVSETGMHSHSCVYIIVDSTAKELLVIKGMAKGYAGEGARGALTLDTYLDLLKIPTVRHLLSKEMIEHLSDHQRTIPTPRPRIPEVSLDNMYRIKRRSKVAHLSLPQERGFETVREDMKLEEVLDLLDFHDHGTFIS